ncbi:PREDICTED: interleukin-1 receptor type 1 [Propithecus coquereli]|nr:PREDICTED: interleukin-1 receptor type 1 [Propithecus coquereli]
MKVSLRFVCFIALLISSLQADKCKEREEQINRVSSANEIDVRACPLNPDENKGIIIWYKNDSKTPVSTAQDSRIHQYKSKLWFVPAKVEDSGHYYCAVRNSSDCLKIKITAKFVENDPNLCYNAEAVFTQKLPLGGDGGLVCPFLEFFKDENNELPKIQWYKVILVLVMCVFFCSTELSGFRRVQLCSGCSQFAAASASAFFLHFSPPTSCLEHSREYLARCHLVYFAKCFEVLIYKRLTSPVDVFLSEENLPVRPVIVSPSNETMEVVLGSRIHLICNVTGLLSDMIFWKWNGSYIDEDDPVLGEDYYPPENSSDKKRKILITVLNISEVESRFYLHPFTCFARNTYGITAAYIQLIHPVPDFQKHMIGIFVMLTVVITCSVFIYKIFKIDIVLWYRDSCYDFLPKKASDGKTYDAYILYPKTLGEGSTSNSDIFVFKVLPEVLEKQCGYKLFIYGRDDYVGEDIVEVINENIKKSRRLIIILVRETSSFGWLDSSSEEQIAMYNALVQDGIKVVLLELEKIQDYEKMPESIKFIKRKHGVIRWSGDFTEGPHSAKTRFWKKVRYHMPAQQRSSSAKHQLLSLATRPNSMEKLQREVHLPLG